LQAKRKYGFVEGKVPKPTTPEKLESSAVDAHSVVAQHYRIIIALYSFLL